MDIAVTIFRMVVAVAFYRARRRNGLLYGAMVDGAMVVIAGSGIIIGEFPSTAITTAAVRTLGSRAVHVPALMGASASRFAAATIQIGTAGTLAPCVAVHPWRGPSRPPPALPLRF